MGCPETVADAYAVRNFVQGLRCFQMVFGIIAMAVSARTFSIFVEVLDASGAKYAAKAPNGDEVWITGPKMAITIATLALVWSIFATLFSHTKLGAAGFAIDAALGVLLIASAAVLFGNSSDTLSEFCDSQKEKYDAAVDMPVCSKTVTIDCFKTVLDKEDTESETFKLSQACTMQTVSGVMCLFMGLTMFTTIVSGFGVFKKKDLMKFDGEI